MRPETEAELAETIKAASGPLRLRGGGTRAVGRSTGEVLETGGLSGIVLYEPGALTLVARAGTPLAEIEAALEAEGQRLPFEPMDHRGLLGTTGAPTVGGMAAANASGPRRVQAGACRDYMLGVRFVDGAGQILRNGGRVMKNVTGYDLVKLMAGSWGTLGVLTEVAFKVLPKPEAVASVLLDGLTQEAAPDAMARALGSPFDISGAAHLPEGPEGTPLTLLRVEGFAESVAYRAERLRDLFAGSAVRIETDPKRNAALWRDIRDVAPFHTRAGDVWRISCKPSDGPELAARLGAEATLFDWGGGLIWALLPEGSDARARLGTFGGHATRVRGEGESPVFQPEPAPVAALSRGLRARFDPRGVLNPGLMA
ncbi:FAD-binding protein [Salipiger abyssi]|uniref:Glycolate oxidase FAD binding subunit n=1 Tax=Salipiger abyssi TaxID=1250539 RepID=A0A1P8USW1_9RHOB|nr:FAD-binding protein [Salipiger abyssi]APZ52472.1 glycolate oxidase FAD binding subunit [Salipiger abyssi]